MPHQFFMKFRGPAAHPNRGEKPPQYSLCYKAAFAIDVGQVANLRGGWLPPPVRCESGSGPIDNRPQLTKLPHKVSAPVRLPTSFFTASKLRSLRVLHAAEAERAGAVFGRRHQQVLAMLVEFVGAGEIPAAAGRAVVAAAAQDGGARVLVLEFVGPLPDVAGEVHHAVRTGAFREGVDIGGGTQFAAVLGLGEARAAGSVAPRIHPVVRALRGVLPFPLVRQALAGPTGVSARVFERHPRDRLVVPSGGVAAAGPIAQEIAIVGGVIVGGGEEPGELLVGHRVLVSY